MPPRDADATRARILDAALAEFAAAGFSGARIDRIARAAEANVRMIYAYFGGKTELFDAVVRTAIQRLNGDVPPDPDDLPGWAGRLFDHHLRDPLTLRLTIWAQLERPESTTEPLEQFAAKTSTLTTGTRDATSAVDLLTIAYAIAQAWMMTPAGLLSADGSDPTAPARIALHRERVVSAVRAIMRAERAQID